jgi:hypothetical protein
MRAGFRKIIVQGQGYRWRFDGRLVVIPAAHSGPPLYVAWGWRDWLEPEGLGNEPMIVTPRFVASVIRFALGYGWGSQSSKSAVQLAYKDGSFHQETS